MLSPEQILKHRLDELHQKVMPHVGQIPIARALFYEAIRDIFLECGRSFGKTRLAAYCLLRWALWVPRSENYYFAPFMKQAREIMWESRVLRDSCPDSWIKGKPNETEMRLTIGNDSFIKLDGSDNFDAYRGVKPKGLIIYDEFKDFKSQFHDAFDPNRAAFDAPLMILGTPPESDGQFFIVADEFKRNPKKRHYHASSEDNPYNSKDWLSSKKAELYARGDGDVWEREYMAKRVKGGKRSIFPMFSRTSHVFNHADLIKRIQKDLHQLDWFVITDPGTITVFGTIFAAINRYSKEIFILDELYEQTEANTTVTKICPQILEKMADLYPYQAHKREEWESSWFLGYDEAAAWFQNEALDRYGLNFHPTQKALHHKETGINQIRDLLLSKKLSISDRCNMLAWEMENYVKDQSGKIPKANDHVIDCLRYLLAMSGYSAVDGPDPLERIKKLDHREERMELLQLADQNTSTLDEFESELLDTDWENYL